MSRPQKLASANLLIIIIISETRNIRLVVRFARKSNFNSNTEIRTISELRNCFIGIPLNVWINEEDTLQSVIDNDKIIQQYKDNIHCTYSMYSTKKISPITKNKRNSFIIYTNMLQKYSKGCIVITLKKRINVNDYSLLKKMFYKSI